MRVNFCGLAAAAALAVAASARADITLGQDWIANPDGAGYDSFHDYSSNGLTPAVRANNNTWLRVDLANQYYSYLAADTNSQLTVPNIAANPVLSFNLDLSEYTWPSTYSFIEYYSNSSTGGAGTDGSLVFSSQNIIGTTAHVSVDLSSILAPGGVARDPNATYLNLGIALLPAYGTGAPYAAYSQHYYIDDVKLSPAIATGNGQWATNGSGSWLSSANWTPAVPNAIDAVATFGTNGGAITNSPSVTTDGAITVGTINFDNTHGYTIAGINAVTMDVSTGSAALNVISGSHTISAPLVLNDDTNFNVAGATSTLTASNVSVQFKTITKSGAGTLIINRLRDVTLLASGGATQILTAATDGTSRVFGLNVATGAKLDTGGKPFVIDYSTSVGTQVTDLRTMLSDGRLLSSAASTAAHTRLGYGDTAILGAGTYGGLAVDNTSVVIKLTYDGDANLDGKVDIADLGSLATNYGKSGVWTQGDFNYDGTVNIADLGLLATTYGFGATSPLALSFSQALAEVGLGNVVPEPATSSFLAVAAFFAGHRRSRRI